LSTARRTQTSNYLGYFALLSIFVVGIWLIVNTGSKLYPGTTQSTDNISVSAPTATTTNTTTETNKFRWLSARSPLSILLLQIIVIITAAKICGSIFRRIGQPPVMGEMVAGIALGPSLLGALAPNVSAFLFPPSSLGTIGVLSQIGVTLFMFIVGVDLDLQHLRERASAAIMVSHASIVVPFLLGAALSIALYPSLSAPNTAFAPFALFIGTAMSITAFPVLARILKDKDLTQSPLGNIALACASIDDVTAWCILAFVIAISKSGGLNDVALTIGLTILFIVGMLVLVKPNLERLITKQMKDGGHSRLVISEILAFALMCAWITETIGIHALFGGFLAGVVMPSNAAVQSFLKNKIEAFSSAILLPLFFVFTGLRTQVALLNDRNSWIVCLAIIAVAVIGKLGGSMLMARWTKMSWRDSTAIGVLMNTRGLIELVVLNIGYDLGILSGRIFVMMVIMALVTTFMTAPLLSLTRLPKANLSV